MRERRREVEGLRLRALEALGEAGLRLGGRELDAAEHAARTAIGLAPFRESSHRLLMEVHEAAGNPAEALRAFDELRQRLRDELGTAPGPAVMASTSGSCAATGRRAEAPAPAAADARPAARRRSRRPPRSTRSSAARDALAALRGAWDAAVGDERRLVLLAGDAGIGKSRLAAEFTGAAHRDGAVVLYGRFDETGARRLPAGPRDAARLVRRRRADRAGAAARPARGRPRRAAAGARRARGPSAVRRRRGRRERQRLFDALAALLAELAAGAPLLLVFDDLQWADSPTAPAPAPPDARPAAAAHDVPRHLPRRRARRRPSAPAT